jgi:uncharacterized SAM-binding protein YcdF (DUF218 family)
MRSSLWLRLGLVAGLVLVLLLAAAAIARQSAPVSNTAATRFDALIVLGTKADKDGNPSPDQLSRVTEAVREYERGVAPRMILTGGAAANNFVEARVMARTAQAQGVPASAIVVEPHALDTIQNACYAERIMKAHGWHSAEVISRPSHLARAGMIFSHLPLDWSLHAAAPLEPESAAYQYAASAVETVKTLRYLIWARWVESCAP